jgi:hypothetical protein
MKLRLLLLLTSTLFGGVVTAHADCVPYLLFPSPGSHRTDYPSPGTCVADESNGSNDGRLRWSNNYSGLLQLFDTDDSGQLLWCAHDDSDHDVCVSDSGNYLAVQWDGNLVIYDPYGHAIWASNTVGASDDPEEILTVADGTIHGEPPEEHGVILVDYHDFQNSPGYIVWWTNN